MDIPITNISGPHSLDTPRPASNLGADHTPPSADAFSTVDVTISDIRAAHEIEANIHEMMLQMIGFLAIDIDRNSFPAIVIEDSKMASHYNPKENKLFFNLTDANDGYVWGEEIMHWIRHKLADAVDDKLPVTLQLSLVAQKNVDEFFGYVGREIAFQAATESVLKKFFSPESVNSPKGLFALKQTHQILTEQQQKSRELRQRVIALPNDELACRWSSAINQEILELLKSDWQTNLTKTINNLSSLKDSMQVVIPEESTNGTDWHNDFIKLIKMSTETIGKTCKVLGQLQKATNAPPQLLANSRDAIVGFLNTMAKNLNQYAELRMAADLDCLEMQVEMNLATRDYDHHLAGYASAVVFMQKQDNLVAAIRDLLPLNSNIINANQIIFNTELQPRSWFSSILAQGRAFLSRML